ncbi:MAG: efflux RND transporter periplasmic adaptor subunit [Burkholderiaceae bacterium]
MNPVPFAQKSKRQRFAVIGVVVVALAVASYFGIQMNANNPAPKAAGGVVVVEATEVQPADIQDVITAIGTLRSAESVVMKSEISGRIAAVSFSDGSRVAKGDTLITFDASIQEAQVNQAKAERDLAAAKLKRTQDLFDKKFLSAAALDDARASEQIAQAKLALAQATLGKMSLRAPFSGVIGIRQVSVGDYIKEGADLVNLEDTSSMKVDFRVPEQASGRLRVGQIVGLQSDAFVGQSFPAKVTAVDSAVDPLGRSLLMRAELRDVSQRLKPGMFMRVTLVLETRKNALTIPEESVVTQQGRLLVFKVVDGKAVSTPVVTGLRVTNKGKAVVEVVKGLAAGDVVVTAGQIKIRGNNLPVKIAQVPSASPAAATPEKSGSPAPAKAAVPAPAKATGQ